MRKQCDLHFHYVFIYFEIKFQNWIKKITPYKNNIFEYFLNVATYKTDM